MISNLHTIQDPPKMKSSTRHTNPTAPDPPIISRDRRGDQESLLCRLKSFLPSYVPYKTIHPSPIIVNIGALSRSFSKRISQRISIRAAQGGHRQVVQYLIDHGSNGKPNRDTKETALYAACYNGRLEIAHLLLQRFPEMASIQTQEMEIPLHAAAKQGHTGIVRLLLEFDYKAVMDDRHGMMGESQARHGQQYWNEFKEQSGLSESGDRRSNGSPFKAYKGDLPFYINQRNINGQTPLFLACTAGHTDIVRTLLEYRPKGAGHNGPNNHTKKQTYVEVDCYTVLGRTPLHSAVQSGEVEIVKLLLKKGADVNLPIKSIQCLFNPRDVPSANSDGRVVEQMHIPRQDNTLLYEACSAEYYNLEVIAILLRHGARDNSGNALLSAMLSMRQDVITTILAHTGVHPDPDYNIEDNLKARFKEFLIEHYGPDVLDCNVMKCGKSFRYTSKQDLGTGLHKKSSIINRRKTMVGIKRTMSTHGAFDTPVAIDWHDLNLTDIKLEWLVEAGLRYNPAIRPFPIPDNRLHIVSATVTRIDVSDNSLGSLPLSLFQLPSLQLLNVSKNKIMHLPISEDGGSWSQTPTQRGSRGSEVNRTSIWHAQMLQRLNVSHNWLQSLPPVLFFLPALESLDAQSNDIKSLPFEMWMAPKLKTANFSRNYLEDLPGCPYGDLNDTPEGFPDPDEVNTDDWELLMNHKRLPRSNTLQPGGRERMTTKIAAAAYKLGFPYFGPKEATYDMGTIQSGATLGDDIRLSQATTQTSADSVASDSDTEIEGIQRRFSITNFRRHRLGSTGSLHVADTVEETVNMEESACLETLDLSHNRLQRVPSGLPCLAPKLTKLTLSHNQIKEFGPITKYPAGLMDLEMSHNKIKHLSSRDRRASLRGRAGMFKLLRSSSYQDSGNLEICFSPAAQMVQARKMSLVPAQSPRDFPRESASFSFSGQSHQHSPSQSGPPQPCKHRRHRVLANLRTLDLSNNKLMELEVIIRSRVASNSDEDSEISDDSSTLEIMPRNGESSPKSSSAMQKTDSEVTLLFPSITMLAVSNNQIAEVPADIQYLTKLSSLKIDGNDRITALPPELGRLKGTLYDLNFEGCRLVEPLASLWKTSVNDVLGYLRSVLDDAKPYTRMKLMLVGKAGIGKTTLLNELRKESQGSFIAQEHFLERQEYLTGGGKTTLKGTNLSTVGVDVGDWTFQKKKGKFGKVTFSTWDFGGQEEFYATHQYFLTKRSLYLVMFNITEWKTAITELQQWLVNIQARAPNSPVIIVGTHYDIITKEKNKYSKDYWPELKRIICERFMYIPQPQEVGLPDVKDVVEISCLTGSKSVAQLREQIYDVAFSLTEGRDKEPFLMQRVPTSYLALEKAVAYIMSQKKTTREEPVLRATEYKTEVTRVMVEQSNVSFHDKEELMQATRFLHNNGILLHYEDSLLSDYFFLNPQWLCDMLAKVVTIAEINPDVKKGVMQIQDLHRKFQDSSVKEFILSLLNKFEVAVTYDQDHLLIPSRLPREGKEPTVIPMNRERPQPQAIMNGNLRPSSPSEPTGYAARRRALRNRSPTDTSLHSPPSSPDEISTSQSPDIIKCTIERNPSERNKIAAVHSRSAPSSQKFPKGERPFSPKDFFRGPIPEGTMSYIDPIKRKAATLEKEKSTSATSLVIYKDKEKVEISLPGPQDFNEVKPGLFDNFDITVTDRPKSVIRRLYILQYIPSGFWSHLISRFLSDITVTKVVNSLYNLPNELLKSFGEEEIKDLYKEFKWVSWQTGIELKFFSSTVFYVKEIVQESRLCYEFSRGRRPDLVQVISPSGEDERSVSLSRSGQMEIVIPNKTLTINKEPMDLITEEPTNKFDGLELRDIKIEPSTEVASRLLAVIVDLIDALVENFYPSLSEVLGTTFQGELFITRVVPCVRCWVDYNKPNWDDVDVTDWEIVNSLDIESCSKDMIPSRACCPEDLLEAQKESSSLCCGPVSCSKAILDLPCPNHIDPSSDLTPYHRRRGYNLARKSQYYSVFHVKMRNSRAGSSDGEVTLNGGRSRRQLLKNQISNEMQSLVDEGEGGMDTSGDCGSMELSSEMLDGDIQVYGFLFEELVLQAMKDSMVWCPNHGRIKLSTIAPDVVFHDLSSPTRDLLTMKSNLEVQRLLGSGTFGLVFQGNYMRDHMKHMVAFKMLQPFPPGQGAGNTDRRRYDIENNKWQVDPVRFSCEAYKKARMELSIILNLDHPHIVPLLGFCHQPMCLILELAPAGALDGKLENYKRVGARLSAKVLQEIIVQVSSAVAYLHNCDIIYRDLKAENVLVWDLPDPFSQASQDTVKVKLADYGISVSALPSGTKGYGGTPGYMAPEIVVYDGKETYTEKVDCFSFAMFMYELFSLQRPFEGVIGKDVGRLSEVIKQLIKDGQRPLLNKKEKSYPTYILDLMAWCWAQDPRERPSMDQINNVSRTAEFTSLREVLSPETNAEITCTCATTGTLTDTDSESGYIPTVWIAQNDHCETSTVLIINPDRNPNEDTVCIRLKVGGGAVQCMCAVGDIMWLGLTGGGIAIYGTARHSYQDMRQPVILPQYRGRPQIPRYMIYIASLQKVFVGVEDKVWIVPENEGLPYGEEWSYSHIELGREVHSLTTVLKRDIDGSKCFELWCGQVGGFITIVDPATNEVIDHDINHMVEAHPLNRVTQMVTYDPDLMDEELTQYVWSYVTPGAYIYKWNVKTMKIEDSLDVAAAIADCRYNSRPRGRISLRRMGAGKPGQVSTMSLMDNYLYIGVTSGTLLVIDPPTLCPLIAISCHEGPIKHLITLVTEPYIPALTTLRGNDNPDQSIMLTNNSSLTVMTVGNGFNDLLGGYPNSPSRFKGHADAHGWCILLWNATQWEQAAEGRVVRSIKAERAIQVEEVQPNDEDEDDDETEEDETEEDDTEEDETESSTEEEVEVGVNSSTEEDTEEESEEDTAGEEGEEEEEEETSDSYKSFSSTRSSTDL